MKELGFEWMFSDTTMSCFLLEKKLFSLNSYYTYYSYYSVIQTFKFTFACSTWNISPPTTLSLLWKKRCYLCLKKWPTCHFLVKFLRFSTGIYLFLIIPLTLGWLNYLHCSIVICLHTFFLALGSELTFFIFVYPVRSM